MTLRAGTYKRGFVLLELIVVVTILGIMFGVMTPLFRRSYNNLRIRSAYKDITAAIRHAQERAIMEEREFRVNFDEREGTYWLSCREDPMEFPATFVNLSTDAGRPRSLPEGLSFWYIIASRDRKNRTDYITFYPNGAVDKEAKVRLRDDVRHRSFVIETGTDEGIVTIKEM